MPDYVLIGVIQICLLKSIGVLLVQGASLAKYEAYKYADLTRYFINEGTQITMELKIRPLHDGVMKRM